MNRTVVVFQSKYGATKRYAEWIAEELQCELLERKNINWKDLEWFDTIIYGGGLYAGGVNGIDILTKNYNNLCHKNLVVFTCGLADPSDKENINNIRKSLNKVFTKEMSSRVKVFHLRGAIDYSKLGIVHKAMMSMLYKMTVKKDYESLRDEDKEMLASYGKSVDFTDKSTILPIINYVRSL